MPLPRYQILLDDNVSGSRMQESTSAPRETHIYVNIVPEITSPPYGIQVYRMHTPYMGLAAMYPRHELLR